MTLRQRVALLRMALGMRQDAFVVSDRPAAADPEIEAAVQSLEAHRRSARGRREEDIRAVEDAARRHAARLVAS